MGSKMDKYDLWRGKRNSETNPLYERTCVWWDVTMNRWERVDLSANNVDVINFPADVIDYIKIKTTVNQKDRKHGQKISNARRIQHI